MYRITRISRVGLAALLGIASSKAAGEVVESTPGVLEKKEGEAGDSSLEKLAQLEAASGGGGAESGATPLAAGYDGKDGFFLRSGDGDFLLRIGGRLQIRNTWKARDQRGDEVGPGEVGDDDEFFTELERARIILSGHVLAPELTYQLIFDGDTDGGPVKTLDAYIHYKAGKALGLEGADLIQVGAGQRKPYFLRQEVTSSGKLQMVDRSLANEFFNIDWNLGAWILGDTGPMFYSFFVTNGFDSINVSSAGVDNVPALIGKLDFSILGDEENGRYEESHVKCASEPTWIAGVSGATDQNNGTNNVPGDQFKAYQFGVDTVFKVSAFSLQGEYMGRWVDYEPGNTAAGGEIGALYMHGFYVQAGYFLIPGALELTGLVSAIWTGEGPGGNGVQAGPGLNWYISRSHKVKLQSNLYYIDISANLPNPSENLEATSPNFVSTAANIQRGEQGFLLETQIQLEF